MEILNITAIGSITGYAIGKKLKKNNTVSVIYGCVISIFVIVLHVILKLN